MRELAEVAAAMDAGLHAENNRNLAELALARCWLAQWLDPPRLPAMRDAGSGELIRLRMALWFALSGCGTGPLPWSPPHT